MPVSSESGSVLRRWPFSSLRHAATAPRSTFAELEVVRRFLAPPVNESQTSRPWLHPQHPIQRPAFACVSSCEPRPTAAGTAHSPRVTDHTSSSQVIPSGSEFGRWSVPALLHPETPQRLSSRFSTIPQLITLHSSPVASSLFTRGRVLSLPALCYHSTFRPTPMRPETPNHALQRTATLAFSYRRTTVSSTGSVTACAPAMKPGTCRAFASRRFAHTRAPGSRSLSLVERGTD